MKDRSNLFFEYGPTWYKKQKSGGKTYFKIENYPIPDGVNCGPVLSKIPIVNQEASRSINDSVVRTRKIEINPRKHIEAEFPIDFAEPCIKPVHYRGLSRSSKHSDLETSSAHLSNALNSFSMNGLIYVIFGDPCSTGLVVKIAEVVPNASKNVFDLSHPKQIGAVQALNQIDTAVTNNDVLSLIRSDERITLMNMRDSESFSTHSLPATNITDCNVNRILSDNFSTVSADGLLSVYDVKKSKCNWQGQIYPSKGTYEWFGCEFGHHPQVLNVACESAMWMIDCRIRNVSKTKKIFSMKQMDNNTCIFEENIRCFKNTPNLPFVNVICSQTVLLVDTRYCKQPVMTWQHMLKGNPCFPQFYEHIDMNVLLLADSAEIGICLIPSKWSNSEYPNIECVSTPKHFSVGRNTLSYARQNGLWFTSRVESHIKSPFVGVTIIPSEDTDERLLCIQNREGTLFYQRTIANNKNKLQPNVKQHTLKSLKQFEDESKLQLKFSPKHKLAKAYCLESLKKGRNVRFLARYTLEERKGDNGFFWNFHKVLKQSKKEPVLLNSNHYDEDGLNRIERHRTVLSYFYRKHHALLKNSYLKSFNDPLSKSLLSVWSDGKETVHGSESLPTMLANSGNGFSYSRAPVFFNKTLKRNLCPDYIEGIKTEPEEPDESSQYEGLNFNNSVECSNANIEPRVAKKRKKSRQRADGF